MTEDRDALIKHYDRMREGLLAAIDGLSDDQLVDPSLDGWSVKDALAHIALWDDIRASEVVRISAGHGSAWHMTGEQDEAYNAMSYELRRTLPLAQVRWELETSRQRLLDAIASAADRALDPSRYGEAGLRSSHEAIHAAWIRRWRSKGG
jgi:hypothetical protein